MKYFFTILATALIAGFLTTAYFQGWLPKIVFEKPAAVSTRVEETPVPTPTSEGKTLIKAGGVLVFKAYSLETPAGWEALKESAPKGDIELDKLILTKNGYKLTFFQAATGGAQCLYPGDPESEGPSSKYTKFVEITTQSGDVLRRGSTDLKGFTVCEKQGSVFGAPTSFGHISISTPELSDPKMVAEIDGILSSLRNLND